VLDPYRRVCIDLAGRGYYICSPIVEEFAFFDFKTRPPRRGETGYRDLRYSFFTIHPPWLALYIYNRGSFWKKIPLPVPFFTIHPPWLALYIYNRGSFWKKIPLPVQGRSLINIRKMSTIITDHRISPPGRVQGNLVIIACHMSFKKS
jgi:hypothetical protein